VKPHITHIRPMASPTKSKEPRVMIIFWNRLKSGDKTKVNHKIKTTQTISARIDITNGTSGFGCFSLIEIPFYLQESDK